MNSQTPLALTMGDPAGIGLELTIAAWQARHRLGLPPFIFLGDIEALNSRANDIGQDISIIEAKPEDAAGVFENHLPAISIPCARPVVCGQPDSGNAEAILKSIQLAVELSKSGSVGGLVTNPIAKSVLYEAGFSHPGHTEYLAELARIGHQKTPPLSVMMLAGPKLCTVPVTIHIPVMHIMQHLTQELIVQTATITALDLKSRFGINAPKLAIAGLNPHAGEGGALGQEDDALILPAVHELKANGIDAKGPLPADTMFHEEARQTYDAAICMYHDQALIPAKALGFHDSVNATLGLPFIRTSPDHGTAFDIAGQNIARCDSLIAAIKMAGDMAKQQIKPV